MFGAGDFETVEIQIPGVTLDPNPRHCHPSQMDLRRLACGFRSVRWMAATGSRVRSSTAGSGRSACCATTTSSASRSMEHTWVTIAPVPRPATRLAIISATSSTRPMCRTYRCGYRRFTRSASASSDPKAARPPAMRVEIVFEQPGERASHIPLLTDSDGRVNRSVSAGNYSIGLLTDAFQAIGYLRVGVAGNFTSSEDELNRVRFRGLRNCRDSDSWVTLDPIRVTVTQPDGSAAIGVWVAFCEVGGGDGQQGPDDDSGSGRSAFCVTTTSSASRSMEAMWVTIVPLPRLGSRTAISTALWTDSGEVPDISVRLPEVHTISVRVVGPEGRPATGQRVEIVFEQPGERASHIPLRTDSDDRVNRSVAAGNYSIRLATDAFQAIGYLTSWRRGKLHDLGR